MELAESAKLLQLLSVAYPNSKIAADDHTVKLWREMLIDIPGDLVAMAAKRLIATSPYPPTVSDLRKNAVQLVRDASGEISGEDAYTLVLKAIRRYGYSQPDKARDSLPEAVWRVVESFSWNELCLSEVDPAFIRNQFVKAYDRRAEHSATMMQVPDQLNQMAQRLALGMSMKPALEGKAVGAS